jgi:hypothetical protein
VTLEQHVERRIAARRCTRAEWHALRRLRAYRACGVAAPDAMLAPAVATAAWRELGDEVVHRSGPLLERLNRTLRNASAR